MRCPKCHYLSFEPEPRCRNCGYDLLVAESDLLGKPSDEVKASPADLGVTEPVRAKSRRSATALGLSESPAVSDPARPAGTVTAFASAVAIGRAPAPASAAARPAARDPEDLAFFISERPAQPAPGGVAGAERPRAPHTYTPADLPLFVKAMPAPSDQLEMAALRPDEDAPLVTVPASPRVPLGVRRSSPEPPRVRSTHRQTSQSGRMLGPFDRDLLDDLRRVEKEEALQAQADARGAAAGETEAGVGRRLLAAVIDLALLGAITGGVAWATFRLSGVRPADVGPTVFVPLGAFLILLCLGYLIMFTAAGGQTVGKMAACIRVIGAAGEEGLTLTQAVYREVLTVPSLLPFGAGLLPALVGKGPAVHDRLAHTRVVRT